MRKFDHFFNRDKYNKAGIVNLIHNRQLHPRKSNMQSKLRITWEKVRAVSLGNREKLIR